MRVLLDRTAPEQLGKTCTVTDPDQYEKLRDLVLRSPRRQMLAEYGDPETGTLLVMNEAEREEFGIEAETAGFVYWSDGNEWEPQCEMRELNHEQTQRLLNECESVLVENLMEYYRESPNDDGHPAHALYALRTRYEELADD